MQEKMNKKAKLLANNKKRGHGIPTSVWSKKMICNCGSSFNRRIYHKNKTKEDTYCYKCYKQKNEGSMSVRKKRGLDTTNLCDIPVIQESKLIVMANVLFNIIWQSKEEILNIANNIIDEVITEKNNDDLVFEEINKYKNKITNYRKKKEKLLDMYLNEYIDKNIYKKKQEELSGDILKFEEVLSEIQRKSNISSNTVSDRILFLKSELRNNLYNKDQFVSEEIIDSFVKSIIVKKELYEWNLNYLGDIIDMKILKKTKSKEDNLSAEFDNSLSIYDNGTSSHQS